MSNTKEKIKQARTIVRRAQACLAKSQAMFEELGIQPHEIQNLVNDPRLSPELRRKMQENRADLQEKIERARTSQETIVTPKPDKPSRPRRARRSYI